MWFSKKDNKCWHGNTHMTFSGYHTCDDRHTHDGIGGVYVKAEGFCQQCQTKIRRQVLLPPKLRDLYHANFNECMKDNPASIARRKQDQEEYEHAKAIISKHERQLHVHERTDQDG